MSRALLAKVQIARKELHLHEDDYRATLTRLTGHASARDLDERQLLTVLDEFKRRGWVPKVIDGFKHSPAGAKAAAQHESARKARAMWISLWQLGVVRDKGEKSLEAFAKRQLKCERLVWADQQQMFRLIEALKAMAQRNGWDQDLTGVKAGVEQLRALKRRLVVAQLKRLERPWPDKLHLMPLEFLTDLAAELAPHVRALQSEREE